IPARAMRPTTTAVTIARSRNSSARSGCSSRRLSAQRYTAARYAQAPIARTPPSTDVGLSHEPIAAPRALPVGTRPDATAPATAPRKNGVNIDDAANVAPNSRLSRTSGTDLRNANADPRRITPNAARVSGTY